MAIKKWSFGFVFGDQLSVRKTQTMIKTKKNKKKITVIPLVHCVHLAFNQFLGLPKAELNLKNKVKQPLFNGRLVSLLARVGKNALHLA